MFTLPQQSARRAALRAWNDAVAATRARFDGLIYTSALVRLDDTWRDANLPLPWYPSMVARGMQERRT